MLLVSTFKKHEKNGTNANNTYIPTYCTYIVHTRGKIYIILVNTVLKKKILIIKIMWVPPSADKKIKATIK